MISSVLYKLETLYIKLITDYTPMHIFISYHVYKYTWYLVFYISIFIPKCKLSWKYYHTKFITV